MQRIAVAVAVARCQALGVKSQVLPALQNPLLLSHSPAASRSCCQGFGETSFSVAARGSTVLFFTSGFRVPLYHVMAMANTSESHTISNFWNTSSTFINHRWNNYMELWLSSPASRVGPVVQLPPGSAEQPHCAAAPGLVLLQIVNLLQVESSMATINITKHLQKLESHSIEALCKAFFAIGTPNCLNQMIGLFALRMNLLESAKMTDPCSCLLRLVVGNAKQTRIKLMLSHTFPLTERACACKVACAWHLNVLAEDGWGIWMIKSGAKAPNLQLWLWQCSAQTSWECICRPYKDMSYAAYAIM